MAYFKIGPPVKVSGTGWDEKDKSNIAKIYIGRFENRFKFIQLLYVDNNYNTPVPSSVLGLCCEGGCTFFDTIALDYRFEFITGISGFYEDYCGSKYLRSICFHTNKAKYGPFIASPVNKGLEQTEFSYQLGSKFDGFFGTFQKYGVESIGIYGKPVDKLSEL